MLRNVVFCCLILVHVKGTCLLEDFIKITASFTQGNLATCVNSEFENSSFPTKWTGCKWSCLDKGFANITENVNSPCAKGLRRIKRSQTILSKIPQCSSIRCKEHCKHSTGNIQEFLREVKEMLQSINLNRSRVS